MGWCRCRASEEGSVFNRGQSPARKGADQPLKLTLNGSRGGDFAGPLAYRNTTSAARYLHFVNKKYYIANSKLDESKCCFLMDVLIQIDE